jgi:hypothetical protein
VYLIVGMVMPFLALAGSAIIQRGLLGVGCTGVRGARADKRGQRVAGRGTANTWRTAALLRLRSDARAAQSVKPIGLRRWGARIPRCIACVACLRGEDIGS